jgi:tRNA dimethylallyltransferase
LNLEREVLEQRIKERVVTMVADGLVEETKWLVQNYTNSKALDSPAYKAFRGYIDGSLDLAEAKALFVQNDLRLAKRQRTWFKRNNSIRWVNNREVAVEIATTFLSKNE